jgi:hypothetical protein
MKIKEEFPPNYAAITAILGEVDHRKPVFCYGDTIYNPFKVEVTADLHIHEEVHCKQQGEYPDIWWNQYLSDKDFRLHQEIEAYGTQLKFIMGIPEMPSKVIEWRRFYQVNSTAISYLMEKL